MQRGERATASGEKRPSENRIQHAAHDAATPFGGEAMRILRAAALAVVGGLAAQAAAQSPLTQPGFVAGGPAALGGAAHALHQAPVNGGAGAFVNAHGEPFVVPACYGAPGGCGGACGGGCGPYGGGCGPYGGGGCGGGGCGGLLGGLLGGAGYNTEQCGPHYFDFAAEYLHYFRDDAGFTKSTVFSNNSFADDDDVVIDPDSIDPALRAGDVDSEDGNGFRLTGRFDVGALSVAEFSYSGMYWDDTAQATQDGSTRLFSIYSLYGTATNGDFDDDGAFDSDTFTGPEFAEMANSDVHTLEYKSELHSAEASLRRYWVGYNPRVSGTVLIGFRYTNLMDSLSFHSFNSMIPNGATPPTAFTAGSITVRNETDNDLAGLQVGGDAWVEVVQGFRVGAEAKAGIYKNHYSVQSSTSATDGTPGSSYTTLLDDDQVAFLLEGKLMAVANVSPCWSIRAGYEFLFISEVALLGDSLALATPYGDVNNIQTFLPTAIPAGVGPAGGAVASSDVFMHGFTVGAEYVW